jgi:hypothetical protein
MAEIKTMLKEKLNGLKKAVEKILKPGSKQPQLVLQPCRNKKSF